MTDISAGHHSRPLGSAGGSQNAIAEAARRALAVLRRRKWLFLGVFLTVMIIVIAFAVTRPKLYTATASMVVNTRELNVAQKDQNVVPDTPTANDAADTEIEILRSPAVADGTVKALDLTHNPAYAKQLGPVPEGSKLTVASAIVGGNLKILRPSQSNVVSISFTAPTAALAKAVADEIGKQYLQVKENSRRQAVQQVNRGMEEQLDALRGRLEDAEAAVAEYKAKNNLLDTQGVTFTEQELSLYKQQEAATRAGLAEERARLNTARGQMRRDGQSGGDVNAVLQSPVIQSLRNQRALVAAQIGDLSAKYRDNHPDLIRLRDQQAAIDRQISAEVSRQVSSLKGNVSIAAQKQANAAAIVNETSGVIAHNDAATVKLNELTRKADALRLTYQSLLERRNAISSQALIADEDARIFSPATMPLNPSYPRKSLIGVLGLVLATIVASAAVWVRQMFDRTLITSSRVEEDLGLPHIANVPSVGAEPGEAGVAPADLPLVKPLSFYTEQLRAVRLAILHGDHGGPGAVTVGITSSRTGEGKSTLSLALARASVLAGSRVLLIDADMRRPALARMLGIQPKAGLAHVLSGRVDVDEALVADPQSGLMLLLTGQPASTGEELLTPANLTRLLDKVRDRFDIILFDTAPTLPAAETRRLLGQLDEVLMLVRWNETPRHVAAAALRQMRALGIEPLGAVMTRVDMRAISSFGEGDVDQDHLSYSHYYL